MGILKLSDVIPFPRVTTTVQLSWFLVFSESDFFFKNLQFFSSKNCRADEKDHRSNDVTRKVKNYVNISDSSGSDSD